MRKIWNSLACLILLHAAAQAQTTLNSQIILASAREDPAVRQQAEHILRLESANFRLPFIEQVAVRTETDRYELRRQEYLTRASVNGLKEIAGQRQVRSASLQLEEKKAHLLLHEALLERYRLLTDYRHVQREQSLRNQMQLVFQDKIRVLRSLATLRADIDLEDIVQAEYALDEQSLKIEEAETCLRQLRWKLQQFAQPAATDWQLDTSDFIPLDQLVRVATELPVSAIDNPLVAEKQAKTGQIEAEYRLEKAESGQVLDYFQLRYDNRPDEPVNRDFSVGIGLRLPFKGSSRLKINALKIEQQDAEQDVQRYRAGMLQSIEQARMQIQALDQRRGLALRQWQESQARFSLSQPGDAGALGPLPLLKARELQLQRELKLLDIERDMFEQYLKILDWSGYLSATPPVNYLSAGLRSF